jgi:hypothetical protein
VRRTTLVRRDQAIKALIESLPEYSEVIERAYVESTQFGSMCCDFQRCFNALAHWNEAASGDAPIHRKEYEDLLHELKQEILGWLDARGYLKPAD